MNGATPWRGHGGADEQRSTTARPTRERRRAGAARSATAARSTGARRQQLQADHDDERERRRPASTASRAPGIDQPGEERPAAVPRSSARKRIQPSTTRWNVIDPAQPDRRGPKRPRERVLGDEADAVERAPEHERPRRAVPEAAEHHRDHQVAVGEQPAAAAAAERDVEEVAQEARQRHVPAAPEVAEARRAVRAVEVLREHEAHQQREPDRHVRVAREVAVDLGRVARRRRATRPVRCRAAAPRTPGRRPRARGSRRSRPS